MDVIEAIKTRKSIRRFTDQPVPRETVEEILRISQQSPSGTNTQPWHVHVCVGAVKEALSKEVLEMAASGQAKSYEDIKYYPNNWKPVHRDRRRGVGWSLYGLLGIEKGDREGSARQGARNFVFFDAPVGIFVTTERYLMNGSWADTGMYLQNHRCVINGAPLDDRFNNWARVTSAAGYKPSLFGYTDSAIDPRGIDEDDPRLRHYSEPLPGLAEYQDHWPVPSR